MAPPVPGKLLARHPLAYALLWLALLPPHTLARALECATISRRHCVDLGWTDLRASHEVCASSGRDMHHASHPRPSLCHAGGKVRPRPTSRAQLAPEPFILLLRLDLLGARI